MTTDLLHFYNSLRSGNTIDTLTEEFDKEAEFLEATVNGVKQPSRRKVIVDEDTLTSMDLSGFLATASRKASKQIMLAIESEMDKGSFDEKKEIALNKYIDDITECASRLKRDYKVNSGWAHTPTCDNYERG